MNHRPHGRIGQKTELKSKDIHATTPATDHGHTGPPACVQVRGARQNNLKNVDVDVPRDAFVMPKPSGVIWNRLRPMPVA